MPGNQDVGSQRSVVVDRRFTMFGRERSPVTRKLGHAELERTSGREFMPFRRQQRPPIFSLARYRCPTPLAGPDPTGGVAMRSVVKALDPRKASIQQRLEFLAGQFGIEVLSLAVMSKTATSCDAIGPRWSKSGRTRRSRAAGGSCSRHARMPTVNRRSRPRPMESQPERKAAIATEPGRRASDRGVSLPGCGQCPISARILQGGVGEQSPIRDARVGGSTFRLS